MPFKPNSRCKACQLIRGGDKALLDRINRCRAFIPGGESIRSIAVELSLNYQGMYNHVHKHQAPNKAKLEQAAKRHETKEAYKELAQTTQEQVLTSATVTRHYTADIAELKEIAMDGVRKGDTKVSAAVLAKLIDIEAKIEEKAKDRNLEVMKMVHHFNAMKGVPSDYAKYTQDDYDVVEEGEIIDTPTD